MDAQERDLLAEALRGTMADTPAGAALDVALAELGWADLLAEESADAIPLVFALLGQTGAHAPLVNDVLLAAIGSPIGGVVALPYAGGRTVVWERADVVGEGTILDGPVPLRVVAADAADGGKVAADPVALAAGRRALAWWLVGTGRAMLDLARTHALDRHQFGRPVAGFQAVRHRLAETYVALEGAEATLTAADDELGALLAKAAAGQAALDAARHCQQVLGGIGFTAEHDLHHHIRRVLTLDGLLGNSRELTREAGALIRARRTAPRIAQL
ncbi:acyl-CoA dehydrogenase [Frankia sp. AgB1.9]|uniref:acyl-CoA dehydrogenase family protein n=1 Tax=unclassified Frankia TaxID=2632575 RepID=UPI0019311E78|nr:MULTISPECIES: acyl-CoA dehydrogenase family protein [unclassified Frankia]MBL7492819.1 acyl-CoA dehydrogenase [Frankia sp. AgW1.1]MBL7549012.1 acyl-CoA dehydrogenase [Frankia sp. AgB1.9]MBL7618166.1 acyl-CoA dehydrogenase [Frankia sp. AgB1.8]